MVKVVCHYVQPYNALDLIFLLYLYRVRCMISRNCARSMEKSAGR